MSTTHYQIYVSNVNGDIGNIYDPSIPTGMVIDPKLNMTVNEAGSLEFTLPITNVIYDDIKTLSYTIDVIENDEVIWTGRPVEIEILFNKNKRVRCEGAMNFFSDIVLPYKEYETTTIDQFFYSVISRYNSKVSNNGRKFVADDYITIESGDTIWRKTDYESVLDILNDMMLDAEGGYFLLSKAAAGNYPITITYIEDFEETSGQYILYGRNLLDLTQGRNADNVVTELVPVCHYNNKVYTLKGLESEWSRYQSEMNDSSRNVRPTSSGTVINQSLINAYGKIQKVVEYDMVENLTTTTSLEDKEKLGTITAAEQSTLANERADNNEIILKTRKYMYRSAKRKAKELEYAAYSINVKASDIRNLYMFDDDERFDEYDDLIQAGDSFIQNFKLGTLVTVLSTPHGVNKTLPIYAINIDLTSGSKELTIGIPEKRELTKILKPRSNDAKTSWKKDSTKAVVRGEPADTD